MLKSIPERMLDRGRTIVKEQILSMALNLTTDSVGNGPPLVVLHGLFGSGRNWHSVARSLAATHSVHCADLRNHGASPWADTMGYTEMADDVLQLIDRLGLHAPAVMGHSMGGKVAMALALRQPERVGRLIVVDIAPVAYADTLSSFAQAMRSVDMMAAASRADVQSMLSASLPGSNVVPFLMQNLVTRNEHFDWRLNLLGISAAMPQLCSFPGELLGRHYAGPTTAIAGELSDYVADRGGAAFRPMFESGRVDVIPGAGHWVHADQPAAFIRSVQNALQKET